MSLNPLEQLQPVTIAAIAAIFLATYLVLRRVLLVPLLGVMARRARKLEAAAAREAAAAARIEAARSEAARVVADATAAAERLDREVKDDLAHRRAARLADAAAQAQAIAAHGREEAAGRAAADAARFEEELRACTRQALLKLVDQVDEGALRMVTGRLAAAGRRR